QGTGADETVLAAEAARAIGARHRVVWVDAADFALERTRLFAAMDQPSIDGVNVFFVARAARRLGLKVALSGLGGDELFGGYDTFRKVPALAGALGRVPGVRALGRAARVIAQPIVRHFATPKWAGLFEYGTRVSDAWLLRRGLFMPWELPDVMDPDMAREGLARLSLGERLAADAEGRDPWRAVQALEMNWYMKNQLLRDADWAGMAHSLEIRVPLVDATLFARLAPWVGRRQASGAGGPDKRRMAEAAGRIPPALLDRPKTGFSIPVRDWLAGENGNFAGETGLRGWARVVYRESFSRK
ncbi:MAG: asparagine synthase C-terminal domain-containing protein, partial [Pseudomonadota bacterium]